MSNVSDFTFYGGGGFGGINKAQETKTVYVPMVEPEANNLPSKLLRSLVPRVYKGRKRRTHKKKKTASKVTKNPRRLSKNPRKLSKKHKKNKKVSAKNTKFQNF